MSSLTNRKWSLSRDGEWKSDSCDSLSIIMIPSVLRMWQTVPKKKEGACDLEIAYPGLRLLLPVLTWPCQVKGTFLPISYQYLWFVVASLLCFSSESCLINCATGKLSHISSSTLAHGDFCLERWVEMKLPIDCNILADVFLSFFF